jgi:hypothetical protein
VIWIAALPAFGSNNHQIAQTSTGLTAVPNAPLNPLDETDSVLYFQNFETGAPGWTFVDLSSQNTWHIDDYNHFTGGGSTLSWWSGDTLIMGYYSHTLVYLDSPILDLTGAVNPILTFNLFHSVETTPGATPPYDGWDACNVWISTNNGATWTVLPNPVPAYNMTSSYAFGVEFNMGPGIPGWGGYSGGVSPGAWVNAGHSLSNYISSQVKIRFAMCADPAYATPEDPTLRGMFVDNVQIREGTSIYLLNDAEGVQTPSPLIPTPGMAPVGNFWHIEEITTPPFPAPPSPTHVARLSNGQGIQNRYPPQTYCAIVSPDIDLTGFQVGTGLISADFYHHGQMNVNDPDPFPEVDIWTIEVTPDSGIHWYNYNTPFGVGQAFVFSSLPTGWDSLGVWAGLGNGVDLSAYAGRHVSVRVYFQADVDSFSGYGMLIDNFSVTYEPGLAHDVSARRLKVPMPTSTYFDTIFGSVILYNLGTSNETQVPAFWRVNPGITTPLLPWASILPGGMVTKTFNWVAPSTVGMYYFDAYTFLNTDLDHTNDTAKAGFVELTPDTLFEFGYDNRQYDYTQQVFHYLLDPGEGSYIRYTPTADRVIINVYGHYLRAKFQDPGSIRIRIYQAGSDSTQPGQFETEFDGMVTNTYPAWQQFDISTINFLQNMHADFWVEYRMIDTTSAHLFGDTLYHSPDHFFVNTGSGIGSSALDFFARAVFGTSPLAVGDEPVEAALPISFTLHQNNPNPFNPSTVISYDLPVAAQVRLAVYDLTGRLVATLVEGRRPAGRHQAAFDGSNLASGIYLYKLTAGDFTGSGKMVLLK